MKIRHIILLAQQYTYTNDIFCISYNFSMMVTTSGERLEGEENTDKRTTKAEKDQRKDKGGG